MKIFRLALISILAPLFFSACSSDDPDRPLVGDEWIDPDFAALMQNRGYIADAKTVTPSDVADIERIFINGSYESYVNGEGLTSLHGLEYFKNLSYLDCRHNQLTQLDVSKNSQLSSLDCGKNQLTQLDIFSNKELIYFFCFDNPGENGCLISMLGLTTQISLLILPAEAGTMQESA